MSDSDDSPYNSSEGSEVSLFCILIKAHHNVYDIDNTRTNILSVKRSPETDHCIESRRLSVLVSL